MNGIDILGTNPFTVFTLITAPAVLTNACAVMSLTTSNRIARNVDRSRILLDELATPGEVAEDERPFHVHQIETNRQRILLLIRALGAFQLAYGSFAATTLVALLGAALGLLETKIYSHIVMLFALACFVVAVGSIVAGAVLLVRETQQAVSILRQETEHVLRKLRPPDTEPRPDA